MSEFALDSGGIFCSKTPQTKNGVDTRAFILSRVSSLVLLLPTINSLVSTTKQMTHVHKSTESDMADTSDNYNSSMAMPMSSVFTTNTKITLLFAGWTTTSLTQYILTLVCLFLLAIFNRFLGALKFQLERAWSHQEAGLPSINLNGTHRQQRSIPKAKLSPLPLYINTAQAEETAAAEDSWSVTYNSLDRRRSSTTGLIEHSSPRNRLIFSWRHLLPPWKATGAWSFRKDGTRALLELVRALVGYFLMLAVMSFNVGVLIAVLLGILCGELALGRFSGGLSAWQESVCHD
ncbi:hypothetical protein NUU61_009966 [Penicillium alfredii]|uniref:Copper transport protein n=1 Tax=Penicillium alfredii TaxID=1506179 RepID=A0A9W9EH30_9EURO|nr:uncharacterized protein NUU61_009966 [Penicillium alfredii]KAJ5081702.1 hypothetical protein NUU61_009966 [Penicillium alfredii]